MKHIWKITLVVLLSSLFFSCNNVKNPENNMRIAALLKTSTNPFFQLMWEGIKREAEQQGVNVDLYWPERETDFEYQYEFLQDKVYDYDVLLLSPSDTENTHKFLPSVKLSGTRVVILDVVISLPEGEDESRYYDVFVGTDNEFGGRLAASYAMEKLADISTVSILAGFKSTVSIPGRVSSFVDHLKHSLPNASVTTFIADYDREKASEIVGENLTQFVNSDLIYCASDHMALGALDVLRSVTFQQRPYVIGYDSVREAQEAILAGEMGASVAQFPSEMGREAIRVALALQEGGYVPRNIIIPPKLSVKKEMIETISSVAEK